MKRKKFINSRWNLKNALTVVKILMVLVVVIFVWALKYQYIKLESFKFEELKKYYKHDEKVYRYLKNFVKDFLRLKNTTLDIYKNNLVKKENSDSFLYPADGQIEVSEDGGYFITVAKTTKIMAPCDGKIIKISNKGGRFDILIQDEKKILYILENLDVLNIKEGKIVKKGEVIGQKKPFELSEKDFIYFKREEPM